MRHTSEWNEEHYCAILVSLDVVIHLITKRKIQFLL